MHHHQKFNVVGRTREGIIGFPLAESKVGLWEHPMAKARQFSKRLKIEDKDC
jgi:hypothetical protein